MLSFEDQPIVGMLHLPPLPGSPKCHSGMREIEQWAIDDAAALVDGGVQALLLENYGDAPFFPSRVPPITVAAMSHVACMLRKQFDLPLGVNVLRNDARSALAIALVSDAQFIRVNLLCGTRLTDQGLIHGIAHELLRERESLGAHHIQIWADVNVKHSAPLAVRPLEEEIADTVERGLADVVIATGTRTGKAAPLDEVRRFRAAAPNTPVIVGSGVDCDNVQRLLEWADGLIIGSAFKRDALASPIDRDKVRKFMSLVEHRRSS